MAQDSLAGFSDLDLMGKQVIPFPAHISDEGVTAKMNPQLMCLNGYIMLCGGQNNASDRCILFKKNNQFEPEIIATVVSGSYNWCGLTYVHSDAFVHLSLAGIHAHNLRQDGVARNLNNAASQSVRPFYGATVDTLYAYGAAAFQALPGAPTQGRQGGQFQFENERYIIAAPAVDTTYPTVAAPSAPTVSAATSGGKLADGAYYVKIAWVTKTNKYRTSQGFTAASAETSATVSGGGGAGRLDVTIPAFPTNAIGYAVYVGTTTNVNYACGGGGNTAGVTHVVKATASQLDMGNKIFYFRDAGFQMLTMGTIENLNPVTAATVRASTSNFWANLWSPYFKDPTQMYILPINSSGMTSTKIGKADRYDMLAGTIALDQTMTFDGEPFQNGNGASGGVSWRSIPEMGCYATIWEGGATSGVQTPGNTMVAVRSCFNNQLIWTWAHDEIHLYNAGVPNFPIGACDFETINGVTYMLMASRRYRGIIRVPIRVRP